MGALDDLAAMERERARGGRRSAGGVALDEVSPEATRASRARLRNALHVLSEEVIDAGQVPAIERMLASLGFRMDEWMDGSRRCNDRKATAAMVRMRRTIAEAVQRAATEARQALGE